MHAYYDAMCVYIYAYMHSLSLSLPLPMYIYLFAYVRIHILKVSPSCAESLVSCPLYDCTGLV